MEILSEFVQLLDVLLHRSQVFRRSNLERHLAALPADGPHDRSVGEERMRSFVLYDIAVGDADAQEVALLKGRREVARVVDSSLRRHLPRAFNRQQVRAAITTSGVHGEGGFS